MILPIPVQFNRRHLWILWFRSHIADDNLTSTAILIIITMILLYLNYLKIIAKIQATPIFRQIHLISLFVKIGYHEHILWSLCILNLERFRLSLMIYFESIRRLVLATERWNKIKLDWGFTVKLVLIKLFSDSINFLLILLYTCIRDGFISLLLIFTHLLVVDL